MTDDRIYLQDICDRINRIEVYTQAVKSDSSKPEIDLKWAIKYKIQDLRQTSLLWWNARGNPPLVAPRK